MNEAETRAEHIDPALAAAGWGVVDGSRIRREYPITLGRIEGHGRRGKALKADYVLEYRNTKLATVEAKAWDEALTEGVGQAKDYATKLAIRYTYATNGQGIYGIDMQTGHEAEVPQYPTPDELWAKTFAEQHAWRDRFAAVPFEDRGGYFQGRYYQDIQHMMMTSFWHPDGTPMSSQQFMEMLFGKLPEFFKNEAELRTLWSAPDTRAQLLEALTTEGFGHDQLAEMQRIIDADKSDLFDVLAHVAYALPTVTREVRAANARVHIHSEFNDKQRAFLDFVLAHYVSEGVEELDQKKLTPLLRLKYHDSLSDAIADLGKPEEIGRVFAGFQKYLYQGGA